ncbi:uncharacterized protein V6R79_018527 [Siganus canaliculatus]
MCPRKLELRQITLFVSQCPSDQKSPRKGWFPHNKRRTHKTFLSNELAVTSSSRQTTLFFFYLFQGPLPAGLPTALPPCQSEPGLFCVFSADCCVCVYICLDTELKLSIQSAKGRNSNCDACLF